VDNHRKLKRGLNDVSPEFFSANGTAHPDVKLIPAMVTSALLTRQPRKNGGVDCVSILPFRSSKQLLENGHFVGEMKKLFGELYSVSIGQNQPWASSNLHSNIRQASLSISQAQEALHLHPAGARDLNPEFDHTENLGIFFDPISIFEHERNLLQILDHVILHVKTDSSESLVSAYQSFRSCLEWNPSLHFLLLVDGKGSERISELVYERFTRIASKYMSHEISFMGWMDGSNLRINEDLFLDESELSLLWRPSKRILAKMLRHDSLHHSL